MTATVLVTGGTGVVGRPLVRGLVEAGEHVTILCRGKSFSELAEQKVIDQLQGDVSLPKLGLSNHDYLRLTRSVKKIFHLAARTDFKGSSVSDYEAVNIGGVANIHRLAVQSGAHLHHVSTAFVCGNRPGIFYEHELECGSGFHNGYEKSKFLAEQYLRQEALKHATALTVYRPAIILERRPTETSVTSFGPFVFIDAVFRMLLSPAIQEQQGAAIRIAGKRDCHLPFIFDDDVARALLQISVTPKIKGKTFHLVCRHAFANSLLEDIFNKAFGRRVATLVEPQQFQNIPQSRVERIIAKKTAMYAPYLDLTVNFDRQQLDRIMGKEFCHFIDAEELLHAFGIFLARKQKAGRQPLAESDSDQIDSYFRDFLPTIIGQQLIANLISLSCTFWIEVDNCHCRSLNIRQGRLESIGSGKDGNFGYIIRPETFLQVVSGQLAPQQCFFNGDISIEGSTMEALKTAAALEEFFRYRPYRAASQ
jgi:nucleoside-diphosphate-sugar epimerase